MDISYTNLGSDRDIKDLTQIQGLRKLSGNGLHIDFGAFQRLGDFKTLISLDFGAARRRDITDTRSSIKFPAKFLPPTNALPSLKHFDLTLAYYEKPLDSDQVFKLLEKLPNLTSCNIAMSNSNRDNVPRKLFLRFPQLKEVNRTPNVSSRELILHPSRQKQAELGTAQASPSKPKKRGL